MVLTLIPKPMGPKVPRQKFPLILYTVSMFLSVMLFYWSGVYCQHDRCGDSLSWPDRNRQHAQYFPMLVGPLIALISFAWWVTTVFYNNTPCSLAYNCMEMPSAVFCSLLAGISAVIEIHYSIDFSHLAWSERWSWAAADAIALCGIHAVLAFALQ